MTREIFISEQAFLSIVLSAAEVYRRECYGLLFGYSLTGKTIVEGAIAYQTAERRFSEVSLFERQNRIIQRVIARFPKYEYLGEFHSHSDYRGSEGEAGLTDADLESMTEGEIALVVAINPRRRSIPWSTNRDGTLSGTLADFRIRIGGYTIRPPATDTRGRRTKHRGRRRTRRPPLRRARVSCPYAVGLLRST
jgi:proteasome lid subunit RPN8/RPN11